MNIGIVCYPSIGGSGIIASMLGEELAKNNQNVHFIVSDSPFRLNQMHPNLQIHKVECPSYTLSFELYNLALAVKIADVSRIHHLDVLHVHYAVPHSTCAYLAKQILIDNGIQPPKIITTLHGTDITMVGVDKSLYDITRFSIKHSDGLTAVSNYLATETQNMFNLKKEVRVIYNFIDTELFKPRVDNALRASFANPDEFLIGHLSNFRPVKRVLDVIDIFDGISQRIPAKLLLIGEGPETLIARRSIARKNISDKVFFLGCQKRVEELLPCLDLMLMPSEDESFGLAALESLASGVPVIGTLQTGLMEVITHDKNGYLHPIGHTAEMALSSVALLTNRALHDQFKISAHKLAYSRFDMKKLVKEYENYYMEIINANTKPIRKT